MHSLTTSCKQIKTITNIVPNCVSIPAMRGNITSTLNLVWKT